MAKLQGFPWHIIYPSWKKHGDYWDNYESAISKKKKKKKKVKIQHVRSKLIEDKYIFVGNTVFVPKKGVGKIVIINYNSVVLEFSNREKMTVGTVSLIMSKKMKLGGITNEDRIHYEKTYYNKNKKDKFEDLSEDSKNKVIDAAKKYKETAREANKELIIKKNNRTVNKKVNKEIASSIVYYLLDIDENRIDAYYINDIDDNTYKDTDVIKISDKTEFGRILFDSKINDVFIINGFKYKLLFKESIYNTNSLLRIKNS